MSNGIILAPYQVINRLENDDQLATVLADNIATALEKQDLRMIPARQKLTGMQVAGMAGGLFVPGLGLATGFGGEAAAAKLLRNEKEQRGRMSLTLLSDAGLASPRHRRPGGCWFRLSRKACRKSLCRTVRITCTPHSPPPGSRRHKASLLKQLPRSSEAAG